MMLHSNLNLVQIPLKLFLAYTTTSSETDGFFSLIPILTVLGLSGLFYQFSHSERKKKIIIRGGFVSLLTCLLC